MLIFLPPFYSNRMPVCVSPTCRKFSADRSLFHQFTSREPWRSQWLTALTVDDSSKASLDVTLSTKPGKHYVCVSHFADDSFIAGTRILKKDAIPMSQVSTIT